MPDFLLTLAALMVGVATLEIAYALFWDDVP